MTVSAFVMKKTGVAYMKNNRSVANDDGKVDMAEAEAKALAAEL